MKLLTFRARQGFRLGVVTAKGVIDIRAAQKDLAARGEIFSLPATPAAFYQKGLSVLDELKAFIARAQALATGKEAWLLDEKTLVLGPAVPQPGKIICIGLNYKNHAKESGLAVPPAPVLFSKFQNSIAAPGEAIPAPKSVIQYDYEAELAVVIGKKARYLSEENALSAVLGYCNANDVSARELQTLTSQWLLGKTLDKFFPNGPYLLTADEAGDPQTYPVRCWLNGELRQNSNTSDMIFPVAKLVSFISTYMTLEPGDVISTGTPEGVILGKKEKVWMKAGDEMVIEVGPLGKLVNKLVEE